VDWLDHLFIAIQSKVICHGLGCPTIIVVQKYC